MSETVVKTKFKQTEIGLIPEDWEIKELNETLSEKLEYGINAPAVSYSGNLPAYIRITDINKYGKYSKNNRVSVDNPNSDSYFLEEGDIVFARTGASVGKTYLYNPKDGKLVYAGFLIKVNSNNQILLPSFLFLYFQTKYFYSWVEMNSMRTGQPGINSQQLKSLKVPLPSLPEQKAITTALSDTDNWIESLEKLIAKKKAIKQGAMQELLTGKRRLKDKDGKTFEGEWEEKTLGEIVNFQNGVGHEQIEDDFGDFIVVNSKFISTEGIVQRNVSKNLMPLQINDITIVMSDIPRGKALGKCYLIEENNLYTLNQRIGGIRVKEDNPMFLYYFLNRNSYFLSFDSGSGQTNLKKHEVLNCPVFLPSILEQTAIAQVLNDMSKEIEILENKLEKAQKIKTGMMQQLLTGKIRLL